MFAPLIGTTRASYQYIGNATGTVVTDDGFVLDFSEPYYGLTQCPDPCVGIVLQNRPDASETYSGLELQMIKSLLARLDARGSASLTTTGSSTSARGQSSIRTTRCPARTRTGRSSTVANSGAEAEAASLMPPGSSTSAAAVELPLGIQAGLNLFGRQGFPTPYFVEAVTNDKTDSQPQLQIGQATNYRTPNVYVLDLQLAKIFLIESRVAVSPVVACFNVLNSRTVLARDGSRRNVRLPTGAPRLSRAPERTALSTRRSRLSAVEPFAEASGFRSEVLTARDGVTRITSTP